MSRTVITLHGTKEMIADQLELVRKNFVINRVSEFVMMNPKKSEGIVEVVSTKRTYDLA